MRKCKIELAAYLRLKMRKETITIGLGGLLLGICLGYVLLAGSAAPQVSSLQSQITALQSQLSVYASNVSSLQSQKAALEAQVSNLTGEKASLQSQISLLNNQITQLNSKIAALNATIAELRAAQGVPGVSILGVYFSPKGGCASTVIQWLGRANSTVHVLIYSFTLDQIGDAILATYRRGVDVKIVFEKQQVTQYSELFRLAAAGVHVRNDTNPGSMHHKVAIIDGYIVLIGSFNWSAAGENDNNENLLVIRSADLAATLEREFQRIWTTGR